MIKIHYVPPAAPTQLPEGLLDDRYSAAPRRTQPFDAEQADFTRGARSRLTLDAVGARGRARRNQRDSLALSREWHALAGQSAAGAELLQTLHDASTSLGADGRPNLAAVRQAQRQLRQWLVRQGTGDRVSATLVARAARVDALLARLLRCNTPAGEESGEAPPLTRAPLPKAAEPLLKRVTSFFRGEGGDARALHRQALKLQKADRAAEAVPLLERAADLAPDDAQIQLDLGRLLTEEGHFAEAEWVLLVADSLEPRRSRPQTALGDLYGQMGQPDLAIEAYGRAIARDPQDTDAHLQLGVTHYEEGRLVEAIAPLQRALQLDQTCVVGRFFLAQISLQENDLLRARYQLGMVAKLSPTMDLKRFGAATPTAIAAQGDRPEPLKSGHHWRLPRQAETGPLPKMATGPLTPPSPTVVLDQQTLTNALP